MSFRLEDVSSQAQSLARMAQLIADGLQKKDSAPLILDVARAIVSDCDARDDRCEVEAVYNAVKLGTDKIQGLSRGLRYVSDPRTNDTFSRADRTLKACARGACAGDCDDASILVVTLLSALGFKAGVRAWGPKIGVKRYEHVYGVVALPKHGPWPTGYSGHGVDTTVADAYVGWEPRQGEVLTYWIEEG